MGRHLSHGITHQFISGPNFVEKNGSIEKQIVMSKMAIPNSLDNY